MTRTDVRLIWRPIETWPREQTVNREYSPFREKGWNGGEIGWIRTRQELEREIRMIGANEAVVQLALTERDIRIDGEMRANARLSHPGVVLTVRHPKQGPLTFACDKWTTWQANIRGIMKGMEALRLMDRYGITQSGEQYTGWKELPSGQPMGTGRVEEEMTVEVASRIVVGWISGEHDLMKNARTAVEDADFRSYAYRQALKNVHPDKGGDPEAMLKLQKAKEVLDAND